MAHTVHRLPTGAEAHTAARSGVGFPDRYVIRFAFPWMDAPLYATHHPDPPHDWAMTGPLELARAASFTDYDDAARVLDFDYGRRCRPTAGAQGRYGRVVLLAEELYDLTDVAVATLAALRDEAAR